MKTPSIPCGYCGGPVSGGDPAQADGYCCYGCRVLGRTGAVRQRPGGGSVSGWWRIGVGALVAGQTMLFGMAANLESPTGAARWVIHLGMAAGAFGVLGLLGPTMVREACRCAARGRLAVEWLFLAGAVAALGASLMATFTGRGAVYYEVVAVLMTVHAVGKALTAAARARVIEETGRLESGFAEALRVGADGVTERVPVSRVAAGDRVRVAAGGGIPVDGVIESGISLVEETALTGEALPTVRRVGDAVCAGGVALDGSLEVRATAAGDARGFDVLLRALRESRATVEETLVWVTAQKLTRWFLPVVLGLAMATFVGWSGRVPWEEALYRALSVVLVACPCALGLAAPLALWSALTRMATRGVVLRRATALEDLARVTHVCIDKTGTLTDAKPGLADSAGLGAGAGGKRWLEWMAELERRSGHPYAQAFDGVPAAPGFEARAIRLVPGEGVEAEAFEAGVGWRRVRVGRSEWVGAGPDWGLRVAEGDAVVGISVDGERCGMVALRERARPGWEACVRRWQEMGCQVEVLSGDRRERLEAFGCGGRVTLHAGLRAEMKADRIRRIQQDGGVALFVGDGVNDGPALAAADVGLAVGGGAAVAQAVADGLVPRDGLDRVTEALEVARGTLASIRGSLLMAGAYNALGMVFAAAGVLHPVVAALLMTVSSTVVAWRAVRGPWMECGGPEGSDRERGWMAAAMMLQIPVGIVLGAMDWVRGGVLAVVLLTGAVWVVLSRSRSEEWRMVVGMLGVGNLAMLAGWWVDAGFGPVMREGVCLCCRSHAYFEAGWRVPWMWVGMVGGGMPWMWGMIRRQAVGWKRVVLGGVMAVAMIAGMAWGGSAVVRWMVPGSPWQFLVAWAGMTVGMVLGMGLACGGWIAIRAIAGERRSGGGA